MNGIDWAGFELLAIGNKEIEKLPTGYRILDGLFQALGAFFHNRLGRHHYCCCTNLNQYEAVRAGGFYVVTIASLRQGLLVLYGKNIARIFSF